MATIIVIGAGVAGLYVASELAKMGEDVIVLESRMKVGGRCRTRYEDGKTNVEYETGPWRLHESHERLQDLLHSLGLSLIPSTPAKMRNDGKLSGALMTEGDMSSWDAIAKVDGAAAARSVDVCSGYEGLLPAATNAANVYHAQRHKAGAYYAIESGFSSLIDSLKSQALSLGCEIRTKSRVTDVSFREGSFSLKISSGKVLHAKNVICCLPPRAAREWSVSRDWLRAQLNSVGTMDLNHVYARSRSPPVEKRIDEGLLAQTIPGDFDNGWFQASYSAGKAAKFWHRMAMRGHDELKSMVEKELGTEVDDVRSHYWPHAVHYWKPAYGMGQSVERSVMRAIQPHPVELEGMYWCGEAFSNTQGWVEGALETSDLVLQRLHRTPMVPRLPDGWKSYCVIIEGRVIDVQDFLKVHPGSAAALGAFIGKDASAVFRDVGHSSDAWAHVFSLQIGWC